MATSLSLFPDPDPTAIREQLSRVLGSASFAQSERRRRFLKFLVIEALAGRADRLKGYSIALEVFGRPPTFDPAVDPIVRIEAARLREKLDQYYCEDGQADPVRIDIPKGCYTPQFRFKEDCGNTLRHPRHVTFQQKTFPERPTLAVLPFVNLSGDLSTDYLADGIADNLISELSKIAGLFVLSRQSSFAFRDARQPLSQIADALNVRYFIEGSLRTDLNRMRISANLVDTVSGHCKWTKRYDRTVGDFILVQDEVCRRIVDALSLELTPAEQILMERRGTLNSAAQDAFLRGLQQFWLYSRESCSEAQFQFARALELDPDYASAHAWIARTYVFQHSMSWIVDTARTMQPALKHALRAIELDERSPNAHSMLGWVLLYLKDGDEALIECRRACALDPDSPDAKLFLSLVLASMGRPVEALETIEMAISLQPYPSSFYFYSKGLCHFAMADYEGAIVAFNKGIKLNSAFMPNHYSLAIALGVSGRAEEAMAEAVIVKTDWPGASKQFFIQETLAAIYNKGKIIAVLL